MSRRQTNFSSSPPRTSSPPPNNNNNNEDDNDMDIDSPIADNDIDSPINIGGMGIDSPINASGRESIASSVFSPSRRGRARSGIRGNRPQSEFQQEEKDNNNNNLNLSGSGSVAASQNGLVTTIWGTNVNLDDVHRRFRDFLIKFETNGGIILYPQLIETSIESESWNLNLNCTNVHSYDISLYNQLVSFPQEVLPAFDEVINNYAQSNFSDLLQETEGSGSGDRDIWVRPFNLLAKHTKSMRNMNPSNIDELVSINGMIIRSTSIIPDIQTAFFRCTLCHNECEVNIDLGRIAEPTKCSNQQCQGINTMELIHNRCSFKDKQLIKIQEAPEAIPDGETPQTIDIYAYDQLVDFVKPGDRVTITGVYRAAPIRPNPRRRVIESVYRTYIDAVHIKKGKETQFSVEGSSSKPANTDADADGMEVENAEDSDVNNEYETKFEASDESEIEKEIRMKKIIELGQNQDIYEILVKSLAPSVYQMDDTKRGILCQLFGATKKELIGGSSSSGSRRKFRSQINILLCGDPGTSKSQLLQYVFKVAPRGIYTSGKGSSAVGLTAYITKDAISGDLVLESGALVLSDRGICCIDEFDKMSESARSILHEVMEQQTVSIAKAGIICTLNARTSILAAANPIESRYNPSKSVVENIDLPPTLMSRFDLIYLILDTPSENLDKKLAKHLISLYYSDVDREEYILENNLDNLQSLTQKELMEYISYSKREIQPKLSSDAAEKLIEGYVEMRSLGRNYKASGTKKTITATPRQLESLIRISEALARMRHSQIVEIEDVDEAIRLHKVATMAAATDPRTGAIDLDSIAVGTTSQERSNLIAKANTLMSIIKNFNKNIIKSSKLCNLYNQNQIDTNDHIKKQNLQRIVEILEQSEKVRVNDWLQDDPTISIINRSDL